MLEEILFISVNDCMCCVHIILFLIVSLRMLLFVYLSVCLSLYSPYNATSSLGDRHQHEARSAYLRHICILQNHIRLALSPSVSVSLSPLFPPLALTVSP